MATAGGSTEGLFAQFTVRYISLQAERVFGINRIHVISDTVRETSEISRHFIKHGSVSFRRGITVSFRDSIRNKDRLLADRFSGSRKGCEIIGQFIVKFLIGRTGASFFLVMVVVSVSSPSITGSPRGRCS